MKILIVGAGIAGLSCALRLLRAGHQVTVADKLKGPIDRVCGEGILPFGHALLAEMDLADAVVAAGRTFDGLCFHGAGRIAQAEYRSKLPGIGIERRKLDAILRQACQAERGFTLWEGKRILPGLQPDFQHIIAADGIRSRWGNAHDRRARFGTRLGVRFRVHAPPPGKVTVHFFKGYEFYLTPTAQEVTGVACLVDPKRAGFQGGKLLPGCLTAFRQAFPHLSNRPIRDTATRGPISAMPYGRPNLHLLGDAWRTFDPISGAGMSFALLSAKLAATHLNSPPAYYAALKPAVRSIAATTNSILFFRGGGVRTALMMDRLSRAPQVFAGFLEVHDGKHHIGHISARGLLPLLRLW